jgi:hypothetical protein
MNVEHLFGHGIAQVVAQFDDRRAGDAGQNTAGQGWGHNFAPFIDKTDVHGAHFFNVTAVYRIQPQHL